MNKIVFILVLIMSIFQDTKSSTMYHKGPEVLSLLGSTGSLVFWSTPLLKVLLNSDMENIKQSVISGDLASLVNRVFLDALNVVTMSECIVPSNNYGEGPSKRFLSLNSLGSLGSAFVWGKVTKDLIKHYGWKKVVCKTIVIPRLVLDLLAFGVSTMHLVSSH